MASSSAESFHSATSVVDDELNDEQLDALLARAADRMRRRDHKSKSTQKTDAANFKFSKLDTGKLGKQYVDYRGGIATLDGSRVLEDKQRKLANQTRKVEEPVAAGKVAIEKKATAGSDWFNLPRTNLTPELKRDLQLLKMRNVLDPHRHYKKDSGKMQAPEYSQIGTIIQGPTEFFSGRVENKKRKKTLVEEVLEGEKESGRFRSKYGDVQAKKTSGKRAFYKALQERRKGGIKKGGTG